MIFDGRNGGTVELLENLLVIRRKGVASFLTQGLKGEKRIPYSSITSVQFKEAGFTTGYIQFGIAGGLESRRGVWDATTDENTVLFTKEAAEDFRRLRDIVEDRSSAARHGHAAPSSSTPPANIADELTRLADLRDRGVLTDEEFGEQKLRLLGSGAASQAGSRSTNQQTLHQSTVSAVRSKSEDSERPITEPPKSGVRKIMGIGCVVLLGLFILLAAIGSQVEEPTAGIAVAPGATPQADPKLGDGLEKTEISEGETGPGYLTAPQHNAVRSAEQYLRMTGFSRAGLIDQLSSDAGEGYSVSDATAAVDSLSVDWNENAVKSARQYLSMTGFSCQGLIEQLSSSAGDKYTVDQATYGARQAGAC